MKALVKFVNAFPEVFTVPDSRVSDLASMDRVEWVCGIQGTTTHFYYPQTNDVRPVTSAKNTDLYKVLSCIRRQRKVEAIKEYRTATNCTLKEAKDFVDFLAFEMGYSTVVPDGSSVGRRSYDYGQPPF